MSKTKKTETKKTTCVHPTAVVDEGALIGPGTKIWHFCHVMGGARIGKNCSIGQNAFIGGKAVLGDGVKLQNNVSVYDAVTLEDHVFVGPSAVFTNVRTPRAHVERKNAYAATLVRKGATIGANATIVCGIEIGSYAFIAAGAVVTRSVPRHAVMSGVPARRSGWACACGAMLPDRGKGGACPECGKSWTFKHVPDRET